MKVLIAAVAFLALSGCASDGRPPWTSMLGQGSSCAKPDADQELSLNLADDMANEGKLHASLANLQNLPESLDAVRLRKARVYRQLGRSEAAPLYRSLLGTCLAAEGEHGLGQLAAARNDNGQAMAHLQRAARLAPTDEKVRNDLGVVYLNQLRLEDARFEFLTAIELKQSDSLATVNLVTLLLYQDNWSQAAELVTRMNLSPEQFSQAQARAQQLKSAGGAGSRPASDRVAVREEAPAVAASVR